MPRGLSVFNILFDVPFSIDMSVQEENIGHYDLYLSLVVRKLVFGVYDQVRHKPGCTVTDDSYRGPARP